MQCYESDKFFFFPTRMTYNWKEIFSPFDEDIEQEIPASGTYLERSHPRKFATLDESYDLSWGTIKGGFTGYESMLCVECEMCHDTYVITSHNAGVCPHCLTKSNRDPKVIDRPQVMSGKKYPDRCLRCGNLTFHLLWTDPICESCISIHKYEQIALISETISQITTRAERSEAHSNTTEMKEIESKNDVSGLIDVNQKARERQMKKQAKLDRRRR